MSHKKDRIIRQKVLRIAELTMFISTNTKVDAFFEYCGHVNSIGVYYYINGWHEKAFDNGERIVLEQTLFLDYDTETFRYLLKKLNRIINRLEKLYKLEVRKSRSEREEKSNESIIERE